MAYSWQYTEVDLHWSGFPLTFKLRPLSVVSKTEDHTLRYKDARFKAKKCLIMQMMVIERMQVALLVRDDRDRRIVSVYTSCHQGPFLYL